jgi:hypothetical protein
MRAGWSAQAVEQERHEVADVRHRFAVASTADEHEAPALQLLDQTPQVAAVTVAVDRAGPHDGECALRRLLRLPRAVHGLGLGLAAAVRIAWRQRRVFVGARAAAAVNGGAAREQQALHAARLRCAHQIACTADVGVEIALHGQAFVVLGRQVDRDVAVAQRVFEGRGVAHVADFRKLGEGRTRRAVEDAHRGAIRAQGAHQMRADEAAAADHHDPHPRPCAATPCPRPACVSR